MDKIVARGLSFYGCHGVLPQEKTEPQQFIIDLELWLDLLPAAINDDINLTVDYGQLYHLVKRMVENEKYNLIETLAENITRQILEEYPIKAVEIAVYKPQAPVKGEFDYFAVKMIRFKS